MFSILTILARIKLSSANPLKLDQSKSLLFGKGLTKVDYFIVIMFTGLFNPSHMQYELDRPDDVAGEPSIEQMTQKAIEILCKNENGFFLLVEGRGYTFSLFLAEL